MHRIVLALSCCALLACGGQNADVFDDEPLNTGPEGDLKSGILLDPDFPVVTYIEVDEGYVVDGDILEPRERIAPLPQGTDVATLRSGLMSAPRRLRWPNATIPFEFDDNVGAGMRELVRDAMALWENQTPVRFARRQGQADFLHIRAWNGDYSYATIGHQGGRQYVTVQRSAVGTSWGRGLVAHELAHSMGIHHEQSRVDRDDHVTIHWDNIKDSRKSNFRKVDSGVLLTTYNVGSIMHYGSHAFSKNGLPTITRKDGSKFSANFRRPTDRDLLGVTRLYEPIAP